MDKLHLPTNMHKTNSHQPQSSNNLTNPSNTIRTTQSSRSKQVLNISMMMRGSGFDDSSSDEDN